MLFYPREYAKSDIFRVFFCGAYQRYLFYTYTYIIKGVKFCKAEGVGGSKCFLDKLHDCTAQD